MARSLSQLPAICIGQKGKYNVAIVAIERKVGIMEPIQIQNSLTREQRSDTCRRCGRKLKNPESIEIGFGTTCYKKFMAESLLKPLFTVRKGGKLIENKGEKQE